MKETKMLVLDYDGTLAGSNERVCQETIDKLSEIQSENIIRVINTGRSLFSLKNVIAEDFPVDYVVFSAGIGIYDWNKKSLLQANNFSETETENIYRYLCKCNYDFMVQLPVPDNHFFHHFGNIKNNEDFRTRINSYESYGIKSIKECPSKASQFVIICLDGADYFDVIKRKFSNLKVVKATSPINHKSVWVEILPSGISKASGIDYLSSLHNVKKESIVAVGNDYYDLDMLWHVNKENAYMVDNAPDEIKNNFNVIESNDNAAIAKLIEKIYL